MTMDENTRAKYEEKIKTLLAMAKKKKNVCSIRTIYDIMRHTNNELWKETEKRYELIRCTERTTAAGCDGNRRIASDSGRCRVRKNQSTDTSYGISD